jgi:hypothetical protein
MRVVVPLDAEGRGEVAKADIGRANKADKPARVRVWSDARREIMLSEALCYRRLLAHHQIRQPHYSLRKNRHNRNADYQAGKKWQGGQGDSVGVFASHVLQHK